jgi:hypothetical protein
LGFNINVIKYLKKSMAVAYWGSSFQYPHASNSYHWTLPLETISMIGIELFAGDRVRFHTRLGDIIPVEISIY